MTFCGFPYFKGFHSYEFSMDWIYGLGARPYNESYIHPDAEYPVLDIRQSHQGQYPVSGIDMVN